MIKTALETTLEEEGMKSEVEAAEILNVHRTTLRKWVEGGIFHPKRLTFGFEGIVRIGYDERELEAAKKVLKSADRGQGVKLLRNPKFLEKLKSAIEGARKA